MLKHIKDENLTIKGDWNAGVGCRKEGTVISEHSLGERNDIGYHSTDFSIKHRLVTNSTLF